MVINFFSFFNFIGCTLTWIAIWYAYHGIRCRNNYKFLRISAKWMYCSALLYAIGVIIFIAILLMDVYGRIPIMASAVQQPEDFISALLYFFTSILHVTAIILLIEISVLCEIESLSIHNHITNSIHSIELPEPVLGVPVVSRPRVFV